MEIRYVTLVCQRAVGLLRKMFKSAEHRFVKTKPYIVGRYYKSKGGKEYMFKGYLGSWPTWVVKGHESSKSWLPEKL